MVSNAEKAQCVLWYETFRSRVQVRREFRRKYRRSPPQGQAIIRWYKKFKQTGCLAQQKGAGRPIISDEAVENIRTAFHQSPTKSTRRASLELQIPRSTIQKVLHKNLKLKSYKMKLVQELLPSDLPKRKNFCQTAIDFGYQQRELIVFTDECTFHLSGKVNTHNCRIWGTENPHEVIEHQRDSPKVNVWCAMTINKVYGPFFFVEKTVSGITFLDMLEQFAIPQLQSDGLLESCYFQLDGAPPHFHHSVRESLDKFFPARWIGRNGPLPWPPRSPDLTPLDYFLWGYVKGQVYKSPRPQTVQELRDRIEIAIKNVTPIMLQKTWENLNKRLNLCVDVEGGHFENLL
jgi:hypothetical protein